MSYPADLSKQQTARATTEVERMVKKISAKASGEDGAALKIQRTYRAYVLLKPLMRVVVAHAHPDLQVQLREFLHGHEIERVKWSVDVVSFLEFLKAKMWKQAFTMPLFPQYAMTLYLYGKIIMLDLLDILEVWLLRKEFTNIDNLTFIDLVVYPGYIDQVYCWENNTRKPKQSDSEIKLAVRDGLEHQKESRLIFAAMAILLPPKDSRCAHFEKESEFEVGANSGLFDGAGRNKIGGLTVCLLHTSRLLWTRITTGDEIKGPVVLGTLNIREINRAFVSDRGCSRPASTFYPRISHPPKVHGEVLSPFAQRLHDWLHRHSLRDHSSAMKRLTVEILAFIRKATHQEWSKSIWNVLDGFLNFQPKDLIRWLATSISSEDISCLIILFFIENTDKLKWILHYCLHISSSTRKETVANLFIELSLYDYDHRFTPTQELGEKIIRCCDAADSIAKKVWTLKQLLGKTLWVLHPTHYNKEYLTHYRFIKITNEILSSYAPRHKMRGYKNEIIVVAFTQETAALGHINFDNLQDINEESTQTCFLESDESDYDHFFTDTDYEI